MWSAAVGSASLSLSLRIMHVNAEQSLGNRLSFQTNRREPKNDKKIKPSAIDSVRIAHRPKSTRAEMLQSMTTF